MSPDDIHVILFELFVDGHDREVFNLGLGDEQAVKWVGVMQWKFGSSQCMSNLNCQWRYPSRCEKSRNEVRRAFGKLKLSECVFDRNFPCAYSRQDQFVIGIKNAPSGGEWEALRLAHHPKPGVSVQQDLHLFVEEIQDFLRQRIIEILRDFNAPFFGIENPLLRPARNRYDPSNRRPRLRNDDFLAGSHLLQKT